MNDPIMYIFINNDLKMSKGRIAARVGHMGHSLVKEIMTDIYETVPCPQHCYSYYEWEKILQ